MDANTEVGMIQPIAALAAIAREQGALFHTAAGWTAVGPQGARAECLSWIEANWTDMRPTLIRQMEEDAKEARQDWTRAQAP
ncbi:MAG TPA: hypothetical protein VES67_10625 [Vicinamibacterales bacterium]|nr:hypothetical protein [Vicinamibacterales bacterium]